MAFLRQILSVAATDGGAFTGFVLCKETRKDRVRQRTLMEISGCDAAAGGAGGGGGGDWVVGDG